MTQRNRRRQRRRGGIGSKFLVAAVAAFALTAIAAIGVTSWVLDVAADAPSLSTCKPIDKGGNSTLFAADGSKLGLIASDEARTPVSIERIPRQVQLATVAIEDQRFFQHGGVDPEGILRAAVKDLEAGKAVEGGSTITQQLVRNLCIANPQQNLERKIVEAKLAIEYSKRHSRQEILGQYLNIASYGTIEGSTAVGVQARLEDLLRPPGLEAEPAAGGAAGRAAAGALRIQPDPRSGGGESPPQPSAAEDGQARLRLPRQGAGGHGGGPRARRLRRVLRAPPALLLRLRGERADLKVRGQHGAPGRARGGDDDRPRPAGSRPGSDALGPPLLDRPLLGAGLDRSPQRPDPGDGLQLQLRGDPVQPRRPGPPPAGLDLQGLRPDHGDQAGDRPLHDLLHVETARPQPAALGPLDGPHRRRGLPGDGQPATGDRHLRQHRLRPARPRRRPQERRPDGEIDGDHHPARRDPGRGDRWPAPRRHPAGADRRLRDPRLRRRPPRPGCDREGDLPQRPRRAPPGRRPETGAERSGRLGGDAAAARQHHRRHRHRRLHRLRRPGRQDRDHRRIHRRLVLRLPAQPGDRGLGRLSRIERRLDVERARDHRLRRHLPGRNLALALLQRRRPLRGIRGT